MYKSNATVFELSGKPPIKQVIPLGLQHVVAAIVGIITPAILVGNVVGLSPSDTTLLIQASLIVTAVATLIQTYTIGGKLGSGLPVIMGISFAYVPTLLAIGGQFNLPTILGAEIVGGAIAILFGIFVKQIRVLFPPLVTGTVIFTIGLSLYPTAVRYMAGGSAAGEQFGSVENWIVAIVTLVVVFTLGNFTKGIFKLGSLLFGMIVGYIVAFFMGMIDFSSVATASWFMLPKPLYFGLEFNVSACISLGIVYIINAVQTIGDLSATTVGGLNRDPTNKELSGGITAQGVISIAAAFFGGLPAASFSQNVGIVTVNKVINRTVFAFASLVLLFAGFIPRFAAILTTIPQAVIGGATISVFATITMTGVRMITAETFTQRNSTIVGLSVALGLGITQVSGALQGAGFPIWVHTVFGTSPVVIAAIVSVILNVTLPKDTN